MRSLLSGATDARFHTLVINYSKFLIAFHSIIMPISGFFQSLRVRNTVVEGAVAIVSASFSPK